MNNLLLTVAALLSGIAGQHQQPPQDYITILQEAFDNQKSNIQVQGKGVVIVLLDDDLVEPRHQKFIIRVSPKQTLLVAHNIDLADKIQNLQKNSTIEFYGEYEWNDKGGLIHWTHNDPAGNHINGWLKYNGKTYQ